MVKDSLPNKLEYEILERIMGNRDGTYQASWSEWMNSAVQHVPDLAHDADLEAAFKRLWKGGIVRLSKVADGRSSDYSGMDECDALFFFSGRFKATITDDGRSYWGRIRVEKPRGPVGFV
jgi:hypothetical protein